MPALGGTGTLEVLDLPAGKSKVAMTWQGEGEKWW